MQLTPRRHAFSLRRAQGLTGALDSYRATLAVRRYKHDELEGDEVGTAFMNNTTEVEVMASHRAVGRLKGSVGGWFLEPGVRRPRRGSAVTGRRSARVRGVPLRRSDVAAPHVPVRGPLDHTRYRPMASPNALHDRIGIPRVAAPGRPPRTNA